jgi:hypothetical protein
VELRVAGESLLQASLGETRCLLGGLRGMLFGDAMLVRFNGGPRSIISSGNGGVEKLDSLTIIFLDCQQLIL